MRKWYHGRVMVDQTTLANRVAARRKRLEQELGSPERTATAKMARGNVCLQMGKYATEKDLQQRLSRLSLLLKVFA